MHAEIEKNGQVDKMWDPCRYEVLKILVLKCCRSCCYHYFCCYYHTAAADTVRYYKLLLYYGSTVQEYGVQVNPPKSFSTVRSTSTVTPKIIIFHASFFLRAPHEYGSILGGPINHQQLTGMQCRCLHPFSLYCYSSHVPLWFSINHGLVCCCSASRTLSSNVQEIQC
jgi:hypothetical protein